MEKFGKRFVTAAMIVALMGGLGSAQRWWYRHCVAEAEKAAQAQQAAVNDYKAQLARFQDEVKKLPPEGRAAVDELLKAQREGVAANPLMLSLARFSPSKSDSVEERVLAGAQAVAAAWDRASLWLTRGLWLSVAFLLGFGTAGLLLGMPGWPGKAGAASVALADRWLLLMALSTAVLFSVSGLNGWFAMPAAFYIAPAVLNLAGFFLSLQEASESESVLSDCAGALAAPAASVLVVSLFSAVVG